MIYELLWLRDSNISGDLQYLKIQEFISALKYCKILSCICRCLVYLEFMAWWCGIGVDTNCLAIQLLWSTLSFLSFSLPFCHSSWCKHVALVLGSVSFILCIVYQYPILIYRTIEGVWGVCFVFASLLFFLSANNCTEGWFIPYNHKCSHI